MRLWGSVPATERICLSRPHPRTIALVGAAGTSAERVPDDSGIAYAGGGVP